MDFILKKKQVIVYMISRSWWDERKENLFDLDIWNLSFVWHKFRDTETYRPQNILISPPTVNNAYTMMI